MNDITALAQRMKAAASEITKDTWQLNADEEVVHIDSEGYENFIACTAITDLAQFISIASPANVLALVEALEAEQQKSAKKGHHASELFDEVKQLQEQLRTVELSNSVLESRTVTVKLPLAVSVGGQGYREQVVDILAAAGIQVIEGEGQ